MINKVLRSINKSLNVFRSSYKVNAITYVVIPGIPVNKNENIHEFKKGEFKEAKSFFESVVKRTEELGFSPAEIQLIRGKKKVIDKKYFGPIEDIKELPTIINS